MFLLKNWYFVFIVISCCVAANLSILERFKIKRPPKWWMSQYLYNKHNTTWKMLVYCIYPLVVFVSEILLVRCANSFDFWYKNNWCVNTVCQHLPWSILFIWRSNLIPANLGPTRWNGFVTGQFRQWPNPRA